MEKCEKRKDNRGRVLRVGEGQRPDLTYQFRWSEGGKRRTLYARTLEELRQKEDEVARQRLMGRLYTGGNATVGQLVEHHMLLRQNIRERTRRSYQNSIAHLRRDELWNKKAKEVTVSDCKLYLARLQQGGLGYDSIRNDHAFLSSVFKNAVEDGTAGWNPFSFRLSFLQKTAKKSREALNDEQQEALLAFLPTDTCCRRYYDLFVLLLETGLRASECAGLTIEDIHLHARYLEVDHQVYYSLEQGGMILAPPKTEKSYRKIPLTDRAVESLKRRISAARKNKACAAIGGKKHFLFPCLNGSRPLHVTDFDRIFAMVLGRYRIKSGGPAIEKLTPHILRHTFCSNLVRQGMDIKSVQYLMGHASAGVTLDVYSHINYTDIKEKMLDIAS